MNENYEKEIDLKDMFALSIRKYKQEVLVICIGYKIVAVCKLFKEKEATEVYCEN